MNTIQVDIRKRFKSNKIKQKSKSQKLFTCLSELTSSAEFEIVLETKPLVHRILVQIFVAVKFLNLSHQSEFICRACGILVEAVCRIIYLDSSHLFLLIDFILLVNFGSKSVKNLIDSSLEQVSGLIGSLLDCFLNTITNIALLVFELFVLKGISIGLLKIKDTKFFEVFTSISMLQQDLAEN
tara:strand:- start:50 stop:598 length:549 start_codon:yes stop_codon:yes gene_type:complete